MNENQNTPIDENFEAYVKRKRFKNIRAYIALALTVILLISALIVALVYQSDDTVVNDSSVESVPEQSEESVVTESSEEISEAESSEEDQEEEYFPVINVVTPQGVTAAAIYEAGSLHSVYSYNADMQLSIASITKLITASVAIKYMPLDSVITVGSELSLVKYDSSVCGLKRGYQLTLEQLLHGLLMSSGNDAAYTVAVNVARYVSDNAEMSDNDAVNYFCGLMNELAAEIGASNSAFANPEGWDDANNYSTVSDLAIISKFATENELIKQIVATPVCTVTIVSGEQMKFRNSNFMLHEDNQFYCPNVTGLKTGSTDNAGKCLVATVDIDGFEYIAVVMGCPDELTRYSAMQSLIEYINQYNLLKNA